MTEVTANFFTKYAPNSLGYVITATFFGYFALGYDSDPDSCFASPEH